MLWMFQRVMFGKLENPENMKLSDLNLREAMTLIPIIFFCFWIGLYPKPFLRMMEKSVANTVQITNPVVAAEEEQQRQEQLAREKGISVQEEHSAAAASEHGTAAEAKSVPASPDLTIEEPGEGIIPVAEPASPMHSAEPIRAPAGSSTHERSK
jgi:hypothetical protein